MRSLLYWLVLAAISAAYPWKVEAQARPSVLTGQVVDSLGLPILFANVILANGRRTVAGNDGRFVVNVDPDAAVRSIEVRRIGFRPATLKLDTWPDTALRIVLVAVASTLEGVRVEAQQRIHSLVFRGFYERMDEVDKGINRGFFITPEELESRKGSKITDFLHGRLGIRVKMIKELGVVGQSGLQPQGLDGCRIEIYLDGSRFYGLGNKNALHSSSGMNFINDFVPVSSVAGIEVYPRSVTAPPKYQPLNGTCGVMLIWTK